MIFSCFEAAVKNSALLLTIAFLFSQIGELSGEPSVQSADKSRQERQKSEHLRRNAAKNWYKNMVKNRDMFSLWTPRWRITSFI
ncbi:MAG: hypothetical protein ACPH9T_00390 [Paracoccaceae bacterium]